MTRDGATVVLDLNNPNFQQAFFGREKGERHQAVDTLEKISKPRWDQAYADNGLKWEKIASVKPPKGAPALYSLRINRARRAVACRDGNIMRFLSIAPDHDATYGQK